MKTIGTLLLALCLAVPAMAQIKLDGMIAAGSYAQSGDEPALAIWTGGDVPVIGQSGFAGSFRIGYFQAQTTDNIQGGSFFAMGRKTLGIWNATSLYAAIGGGKIYDFKDEDDGSWTALKFELGLDIYRRFGVGLGADYSAFNAGPSEWFIYGMIDLMPRLL